MGPISIEFRSSFLVSARMLRTTLLRVRGPPPPPHSPPQAVVLFVQKAATPETRVIVATLAEADPALADMRTLVIIGATATRLIPRTGQRPWVYTPRAETGIAR